MGIRTLDPFNNDHEFSVWFVCTSLVRCGHDDLYLKRSLKSKSRSRYMPSLEIS